MSYMLVAYTGTAFQEFVLPEMDNANYGIVLRRERFGLLEDIEISLEIVDRQWKLVKILGPTISSRKSMAEGKKLAVGDMLQLNQGEYAITVLVMRATVTLDGLSKYHVTRPTEISIGQAADNHICYALNALISKHHAVLEITEDRCLIRDCSTNGIFMGSQRIKDVKELKFGDTINILGLQMVWLGEILAIGSKAGELSIQSPALRPLLESPLVGNEETSRPESRLSKNRFRRSPRSLPALHAESLEIEAPPQPPNAQQRPLLLTIGPSLTMALPMILGVTMMMRSGGSGGFMYMGIVIAGSSAFLGAMWAVINLRYAKKQVVVSEKNRLQRYQAYLDRIRDDLQEKYEQNQRTMKESYPAGKQCAAYDHKNAALWNRNKKHEDFMLVRLGLGRIPFQVQVLTQKERFKLYDDNLAKQPLLIRDQYANLENVPVGVDLLRTRLLGLIGGKDKAGAIEVARCMAVQIAANLCYTDVKLVFLYRTTEKRDEDLWRFARWLPHCWSEDKRTRYIAANQSELSEVCFALTNIFRRRAETPQQGKKLHKPQYVIFLEDAILLEGEPILKYLIEPEQDYGVSLVVLAERYEDLPNSCVDIVQNDSEFVGNYHTEDAKDTKRSIRLDELSVQDAEDFARRISNIEVTESESGGEIPESLTFLDMYKVKKVADLDALDRWRKNRAYENMRVPIGQKAGGADWFLDIHEKYHGPHGLMAGTTGSGKSETLQTYMLSLALNFSPDDLAFFVIDFKGGGMANLFAKLPHMAGQISNLSGNQVHRAMVSIKSENRRRQRTFLEYGVNHVDQYMRLYKAGEATEPIPHLLIVIDEFAELKREEPEFMKELISVAQVGRSLGVHLILATQKPSGTVDNNIWSNTKFRVCLRVQDRQDSNDMLKKPDAAFITQTGRGYMQVGNDEIYELFQSAYSGADYDEQAHMHASGAVHMKTNTGKSAIVGNYGKIKERAERRLFFLVRVAEIAEGVREAVELMDQPANEEIGDLFLAMLYEALQKAGLEYRPSKLNTQQLKNFLQAMRETDETLSLRENVLAVLARVDTQLLPEQKMRSQLDAVVDYLDLLAKGNGYDHQFHLWLPVLGKEIFLDQLQGYREQCFDGGRWPEMGRTWNLEAYIGQYDHPVEQAQAPLCVNLSTDGHLAVCGAVVSGKTTFLQSFLFSLMQRYSPDWLNVYAIDFSSRALGAFANFCHVGGVLYEDDVEKLGKLFTMLADITKKRKQLFCGGNYRQYVQLNGSVPAIVLAIDNFANFKEKTNNSYESELISLAREGETYGIFLAISAGGFGSADLQSRIAEHLRNIYTLELGDKFKYADVLRTTHFDVLPEANIKGRGLAIIGGNVLEYQVALAVEAENDYERAAKIAACGEAMNQAWQGSRARAIPAIPEKPVWSQFVELPETKALLSAAESLPYGYNAQDANVQTLPLSGLFCWVVCGKSRSGKTNLLRILMHAAERLAAELCVVDLDSKQLKQSAELLGARYLSDPATVFQYFGELVPIFQERNKKKCALVESGLEGETLYRAMKEFPPIMIFVDDLNQFLQMAYTPPAGVGVIGGFLENILEKGSFHNIYFFIGLNTDDIGKISGKVAYQTLLSYKSGIHLGGNVLAHRFFDFNAMPHVEQGKVLKPGVALLPPTPEHPKVTRVVVPTARG